MDSPVEKPPVEKSGGEKQVLKAGAHIHMMGICGTAMGSLAGILNQMGYKITGSDQNVYPPMSTQLEKLGIKLVEGYKAEHLHPRPDFVIVGNVISRTNPEAQELLRLEIPYTSLPKALGEFVIQERDSIVVAGTHGKTTTTSLAAWTADQCELKPGYLIGGIAANFGYSFRVPTANTFVIEGDEYDTAFFDKVPKFIHYKPRYALLTSVEFDHADIYRDLEHVKDAFQMLLDRIRPDGALIAHAEDANIADLLRRQKEAPHKISYPVVTYGLEKGDVQARNIRFEPRGCLFDIYKNGKLAEAEMVITMFGRYNVANALAVWALADLCGWPKDKVRAAFLSFKGVKRRQEVIGEPRGITVIEDFAHHPTAVRVTLDGIRERFPKRKLFAVFEPRSATSRRNIFQQEYAEAFDSADHIFFADVFNSSALEEGARLHPSTMVENIRQRGRDARFVGQVDDIVAQLGAEAKAGDVIVIMSNGGFGGIYQKLLSRLA